MLRTFAAAIVTLGLIAAPVAHAKPCRDATTGKFTKCEKPKPKKCRDTKGRYTKCDAAAAQDGAQKDATQPTPSAANPS